VNVVKGLLGDSHLAVCSEMEVYEAAMRWIDFDRPNRLKCLQEAIKTVRFSLIAPDEISNKIEIHSVFHDNPSILKMIFNAYKYHALSRSSTCKIASFVKKEDARNVCLKGASVPDEFVKAIVELSDIAHKLKADRNYTTNKLLD
jgi:kelch-like protein 7